MTKKRDIPKFAAAVRTEKVPPVLLPYQQRWVADRSSVKLCEKSRRVGISWAEASDDTLYAASSSGNDVWYIGYNKEMAEEFILDCAMWARFYNEAASAVEEGEEVFEDGDEKQSILTYKITFASGNRITALSSRPKNLRGKQGRIIIDEAAFHENLDELIKAAMALLMWGGEVRIISTHDGDSNPFNEIVNEIRAGKLSYSLHRITLDNALADGLYKRICMVMGKAWSEQAEAVWRENLIKFYRGHADEELFCIPSQGKGVYLPLVILERCMNPEIPVLRYSCNSGFAALPDHIRKAEAADWCRDNLDPVLALLDPKQRHYFGEDFGRTGDLTGIWPLAERQNITYHTPFIVELANVPFKEQEFILFYVLDRLPRFMGGAMDARGNGQYLGEVAMQKYGSGRIMQVMISQEWYRNNMPRLKAFLEDCTMDIPQDVDVRNDFRAIKMEKGVAKVPENARTEGKDGSQRHGDLAIAAAMAVCATRELSGQEYAYEPVKLHAINDMSGAIRATSGGFRRHEGAI